MNESLHIHERLNNVLSILDHLTLTGFQQFNAVSVAMRELASLDQDIAKAEKEQQEAAAPAEEADEEEPCEACVIHFDKKEE